ncbi:MAG: WXG100 family type VII secretion target, partial [Haloechinothrix sp.]
MTATVIPLGDDALDRAVVGSGSILADLDIMVTFAVRHGLVDGSTLCLDVLPSEFVAAVVAVDPGMMRLAASDLRAAAGSEAEWSDELRAQAWYLQECWDGAGSEACVSSTLALADGISANDDSLRTRTTAVARYASTVGRALAAMRRDLAAALLHAKQEDVAEVISAAARLAADHREIITGEARDGADLQLKAGLRVALAVLAMMTNAVTRQLDRLAALAREPDPYADTPLTFPTFDVPDSPPASGSGNGDGPVVVAPRPPPIPAPPVDSAPPTDCHGERDGQGDSPDGERVPDTGRAEARVPDVPRPTPSAPSHTADQTRAPDDAGSGLEVAGAYVAAGLAVAIAAAVAVLLARRPVPGGNPPASRRSRNAVAARQAALARMVPPFGHAVHQATPPPAVHPPSYRPPVVGVDPHGGLIDVSTFPGIVSFTGPGALAVLRALIATLLASDPNQGRPPGMVVITKTDLGALLLPQLVPEWLPPTLVLTESEADALARLDTEIVTRTRLLQDSGHSSLAQWRASAPDLAPTPAALVISCRREYAARLAAAARSGRGLDLWIIALPDGTDTVTPPGTWYVDGDYHATAADTSGAGTAQPDGTRLHHVGSTQLHDALNVLGRAAIPPRNLAPDYSPPAPADKRASASHAWPPRPFPSTSG